MFEWDEQVGIFSGDGDDVRHFGGPLLSPPGKADSGMWLGQDGTFRAVTWRSMNRWCQRKARYEMVDRVLPELNALRSGVYGATPARDQIRRSGPPTLDACVTDALRRCRQTSCLRATWPTSPPTTSSCSSQVQAASSPWRTAVASLSSRTCAGRRSKSQTRSGSRRSKNSSGKNPTLFRPPHF